MHRSADPRFLEALAESSPDPLAQLDRDLHLVWVNRAYAETCGRREEDLLGRDLLELHPHAEIRGSLEHARDTGGAVVLRAKPFAWTAPPGRGARCWDWTLTPVKDERGAVAGFALSLHDVTDGVDVRVAQTRAASLARFPEENPDPVLRVAPDLTLGYANPAARTVLAGLGLEVGRPAPPEIAGPARRVLAGARLERADVRCGDQVFSMTFCASGGEVNAFGHEITARKRAEEAVRESERIARARAAELQAVLDTVPAAVWIARDRLADRVDANRLGAELLQLPLGSNVAVSAGEGGRPRGFRLMRYGREVVGDELPIRRAARTGMGSRDVELDIVLDGGRVVHMLGNTAPLCDERGEPCGSVGAFIDITARKEAEIRLREASRRKDEFLGMLSHELRNPLAPIGNSLFILERVAPDSEQAERAKTIIRRQLEHLTRLVDDLLDVTRIARGKIELRRRALDLQVVVARTVEDHRSLLDERGLTLRLELPPVPLWVDGDPTRLAQVVGNLLRNAAKFTPAGGRVDVSLVDRSPVAELMVSDSGVGMEPELLAQVFEPFVQAESGLARTEGGLGLGLALVRGIAELHSGTVRAESAGVGAGSTFVLQLPITEPEERGEHPRPAPGRAGRSRRVLIVEDNRDAALSLAEIVEMMGHEVEVAHDGPEAIARARAHPPEVVLCDIGLPGMTGYELARALRQDGPERLRIIAVSGYAQPEDRQRALEAGFDGHIAKPPDHAELTRLLG